MGQGKKALALHCGGLAHQLELYMLCINFYSSAYTYTSEVIQEFASIILIL